MPASALPHLPAIPPIEVHRSPVHGLGVFASRAIRAGKTIVEYVGERIDTLEADVRYDDDRMAQHHTFLFAVDDATVIDGAVGGNDARFINHSCEPNCEAYLEGGRVFIAALRAIPLGEELFYDYALDREDEWQPHWAKLYACRCGAKTCRGTLLRRLPPAGRAAVAKEAKRRAKPAKKGPSLAGARKSAAKKGPSVAVGGRKSAAKKGPPAAAGGRKSAAKKGLSAAGARKSPAKKAAPAKRPSKRKVGRAP